MITVVHHSADYDGLFCRQIAAKFLPDANLIGWDFGDPKLSFPADGSVYLLDLPLDCFAELPDINEVGRRLIWIDHHKSSIEKWPEEIPGYRIDGVAASRLAWQWFDRYGENLPTKTEFLKREIAEPSALTLAGEYDVWQHENSNGDDITFQFGLDCDPKLKWARLLSGSGEFDDTEYIQWLLEMGRAARECYRKRDAQIVTQRGFTVEFEGLKFIALNTARCNSQSFEAAVRPEYDGCLAFYWNGKTFIVSLYGVPHKPDIDLSKIAVKHGGGGHKQACGFQAKQLPWLQK